MLLFGRMSAKSKCIEPNTTFFSSNIIVSQPWNGSIIPLQMVSSIFRTNKRKMRRFFTLFNAISGAILHAISCNNKKRHAKDILEQNEEKTNQREKIERK